MTQSTTFYEKGLWQYGAVTTIQSFFHLIISGTVVFETSRPFFYPLDPDLTVDCRL